MINLNDGFVLDDGREYLCFSQIELDGKNYIYLITTEEPIEIRFAEQIDVDGETQIRVIGNRAEKLKLIQAFQAKAKEITEEA